MATCQSLGEEWVQVHSHSNFGDAEDVFEFTWSEGSTIELGAEASLVADILKVSTKLTETVNVERKTQVRIPPGKKVSLWVLEKKFQIYYHPSCACVGPSVGGPVEGGTAFTFGSLMRQHIEQSWQADLMRGLFGGSASSDSALVKVGSIKGDTKKTEEYL